MQVLQQDEQDNIITNYLATHAIYHPESKTWESEERENCRLRRGRKHHDVAGTSGSLTINDWSETPFRLAQRKRARGLAQRAGTARLSAFQFRFSGDVLLAPFATHLQYRLALPWTCLVVVFIAAPLGIGFSRRGILSSVAAAILLVFAMNFLTHLFLALGEGDRIQPGSRPGRRTSSSPSLACIFSICARLIAKCRGFDLVARDLQQLDESSANDWPIKHRADACAATQRPFAAGEQFYTLLFREADGFRREDLSEEAWATRNENIRPFSFWQIVATNRHQRRPEPIAKENAEDLLRRLLAEQ